MTLIFEILLDLTTISVVDKNLHFRHLSENEARVVEAMV